jgi:anhydro-N-acetylmuramic acid kinase
MYIGILSGTSLDAVDVAAVDFSSKLPVLIAKLSYPMPQDIKEACLEMTETAMCNIDVLGQLDCKIGLLFAEAVLKLLKKHKLNYTKISAIGSHGINIRHRPDLNPPFTMQIGDPNIISEITKIPTISDFRRRDLASGGQGAPLASLFHHNVFTNNQEERVIVNIGGISNATFLPALYTKPVIGFDIGPGNCLMDAWCQKHFNQAFDKDGILARSGTVIQVLLNTLLADPYFITTYPKSTGREYFNLTWFEQKLDNFKLNHADIKLSNHSILRTLLELTAESITNTIKEIMPNTRVYICGGGANNNFLLDAISSKLPHPVATTEVLGIHQDWVEAALFAWLAKCNVEGKQLNLHYITGGNANFPLGGSYGFKRHSILQLSPDSMKHSTQK